MRLLLGLINKPLDDHQRRKDHQQAQHHHRARTLPTRILMLTNQLPSLASWP